MFSAKQIWVLFTSVVACVLILETIAIYAEMFYLRYLTRPDIPKVVFVELMKLATKFVEFSFDKTIYRMVHVISISSALGPTMADIFVGFHEVDFLSKFNGPEVYFR